MSIDTFIQEIETRKKNDLAELDKKLNDKKSETDAKKNSQVKELKEKYANEAKTKADREGAIRVEAVPDFLVTILIGIGRAIPQSTRSITPHRPKRTVTLED